MYTIIKYTQLNYNKVKKRITSQVISIVLKLLKKIKKSASASYNN